MLEGRRLGFVRMYEILAGPLRYFTPGFTRLSTKGDELIIERFTKTKDYDRYFKRTDHYDPLKMFVGNRFPLRLIF